MRILLVDDHVQTVRALRSLLVAKGHQVTTAGTLADARRACEGPPFDLMLCDLGLPDGDGRELAAVARACGVRAVAVTGYDRGSPDSDGFWDYLVKPVSFDRVTALLADVATAGPPAWAGGHPTRSATTVPSSAAVAAHPGGT